MIQSVIIFYLRIIDDFCPQHHLPGHYHNQNTGLSFQKTLKHHRRNQSQPDVLIGLEQRIPVFFQCQKNKNKKQGRAEPARLQRPLQPLIVYPYSMSFRQRHIQPCILLLQSIIRPCARPNDRMFCGSAQHTGREFPCNPSLTEALMG